MAFNFLARDANKIIAPQIRAASQKINIVETKRINIEASKLTEIISNYLENNGLEDVDIKEVLSFILNNRETFPLDVDVRDVLIAAAMCINAENPVQKDLLRDLREEMFRVQINISIDDYVSALEASVSEEDNSKSIKNSFSRVNLDIRIKRRLVRAVIRNLDQLLSYTPTIYLIEFIAK